MPIMESEKTMHSGKPNAMSVDRPSATSLSRRGGERGAVLAYTVVSVLFLFLAVGLGVDLSHMYTVKAEAQNAADAAALAGATALRLDEGDRLEGAMDRAVSVLNQNKYNFDNKEFDDVMSQEAQRALVKFAVNFDGPYVGADEVEEEFGGDRNIRFVQVTTPGVPVSIFFSVPILGPSRNISATAMAGLAVVTSDCIVSLRPNEEKTLYVSSDSSLTATQCNVQVNSCDSQGFYVSSSSEVTAGEISVCGSSWHESGSEVNPEPDVNQPQLTDPYAYLNAPPGIDPYVGPCNYNSLVEIKSDTPNKTLNPGVYCGGIKIGSNVSLATFNPGLYVINGYGLEISSDTNVQGAGVTFINTAGYNGVPEDKYTPIKIVSNSNANLSAPTKDFNPGLVPEVFLDLLFYQDPNCGSMCTDTSLKNIIQINNTDAGPGAELMLSGALYFPTQILAVESQSSLIVDGLVVAYEIHVESNSHLNVRVGEAGSLTVVPIVLYK
jgi:hypothetical protein